MARSVTLFHVSDVHFGVADLDAHRWFAESVALEKPDAVICTGDITQRAKRSEYAAAKAWFGSFGVPIVLEPGNHDMPYYNPFERFWTPFARFERLQRAVAEEPELPGVALVSLRTTVPVQTRFPWSDGVVTADALDRTLHELERIEGDERYKIVLCHHPLMAGPPGAPNPTIRGDQAFAALARVGADAVLSGHVHDAFDLTFEVAGHSLRMIGAGTLSTRLRSTKPSFNVLRHDPAGGLRVEARTFPEQQA